MIKRTLPALTLLIFMTCLANAEWHQWRGPNRDGISPETDFLKTWPKAGPKEVWRVQLGAGFSGISVSDGRLYTMYGRGNDEFVGCFNAATGEEIWHFRSDDLLQEHQGGNGPRSTPTIDGDMLYAISAFGKLYALKTENGEKVWSRDFMKDLGSKMPKWGVSISPIVDGDLLLTEVGGKRGKSIVAFDKKTGKVVWESHNDPLGYSAPIIINAAGVRQAIFFTGKSLVSVSPTNGDVYWTYPWETSYEVNAATPIFIPDNRIFISSGYGKGAGVVEMRASSGKVKVREVWANQVMMNHFSSSVYLNGYLYGYDNTILMCINAATGKEMWKTRGYGKGTLILADGHLILLGERGQLGLAEATPKGLTEKALVKGVLGGKCWTAPTLSDGKLYLRNEREMVCLDLTVEG